MSTHNRTVTLDSTTLYITVEIHPAEPSVGIYWEPRELLSAVDAATGEELSEEAFAALAAREELTPEELTTRLCDW